MTRCPFDRDILSRMSPQLLRYSFCYDGLHESCIKARRLLPPFEERRHPQCNNRAKAKRNVHQVVDRYARTPWISE